MDLLGSVDWRATCEAGSEVPWTLLLGWSCLLGTNPFFSLSVFPLPFGVFVGRVFVAP